MEAIHCPFVARKFIGTQRPRATTDKTDSGNCKFWTIIDTTDTTKYRYYIDTYHDLLSQILKILGACHYTRNYILESKLQHKRRYYERERSNISDAYKSNI